VHGKKAFAFKRCERGKWKGFLQWVLLVGYLAWGLGFSAFLCGRSRDFAWMIFIARL